MKRMAALVGALLLTLVLAAPAAATKPISGGGDYMVIDITSEGCPVLLIDGTLVGTLTVCQRGQDGTDKAEFSGRAVLGGEELSGTLAIGFSKTDRFAILGGTGELAALHGQGTATDDLSVFPPVGTYEGSFHIDP